MKRIILIFVGIISVAYGQDAFFSNFYRSYALSNPSAIIMQDDINITALHRSQWPGIVSPFTSSQLELYYGIRNANSNEKIGSSLPKFIHSFPISAVDLYLPLPKPKFKLINDGDSLLK